jgi:hypothetical protein
VGTRLIAQPDVWVADIQLRAGLFSVKLLPSMVSTHHDVVSFFRLNSNALSSAPSGVIMAIVFSAKIQGVSVENMHSASNFYTGESGELLKGPISNSPSSNTQDSRCSGEVSPWVYVTCCAVYPSVSLARQLPLRMLRTRRCLSRS